MNISKKAVGISIAVILIIAAVILIQYLYRVKEYRANVSAMTFSSIDISTIPDGEYIGESDVDFISVKVAVLIQNGKIISIDLLKHENDRGAPAEKIVDEIIRRQTTDVDVVSGATNSSKVIRKAVENALLQ